MVVVGKFGQDRKSNVPSRHPVQRGKLEERTEPEQVEAADVARESSRFDTLGGDLFCSCDTPTRPAPSHNNLKLVLYVGLAGARLTWQVRHRHIRSDKGAQLRGELGKRGNHIRLTSILEQDEKARNHW